MSSISSLSPSTSSSSLSSSVSSLSTAPTTPSTTGGKKKTDANTSSPSSATPGSPTSKKATTTFRVSVTPTLFDKGHPKFDINVPVDATFNDILRRVQKKDAGATSFMATVAFAATDNYQEPWKIANDQKTRRFMTMIQNSECHGSLAAKRF
ncbi:hypothetical protein IAT38_002439 [Cryptococcus sp. DSM 104549]